MTRELGAKSSALLESYRNSWAKLWLPPERLSLPDWAERNLVLSREYASRPGELSLFGWQRKVFEAFTDPAVETVVLMCARQLFKTLFIQACLGYLIDQDPCPILIIEPNTGDAKKFSRERLGPMIRDCATIRSKVSKAKGRDSANTILQKTFTGGSVRLIGAISPSGLAGSTYRVAFFDETDKYLRSAGVEGDPIDIASECLTTFGPRKKKVLCCTPTILGRSRIGKAYEESDRRKPWVPCPACGEFQILKFAGQVKFEPEPAYECAHCKARWDDDLRKAACEQAEWRAEAPFRGIAGFWISHLYSPFKPLAELVDQYRKAEGDRERYKTFVNCSLAELWQEEGETPDHEILYARRESYPHTDAAVVPQRGLFLTAAVDVQENPPRLEVEVKAWGRNRENWSVGYWVLQHLDSQGQPLSVVSPELWLKLDELLQRDFRHESGQTMPILLMVIDTGKNPKPVYDFCLKHPQPVWGPAGAAVVTPRTVAAIKGDDNELCIISKVSKEDAARKRQGVRIYLIGTHCVKEELYSVLRHIKPSADGKPVAGCYHFPQYEKHYFEGLCSEKRIVTASSAVEWQKLPNARNEPLDLSVYNRGAAAIFGIDRTTFPWDAYEEALKPIEPEQTAPQSQERAPQRESWIPKRKWF